MVLLAVGSVVGVYYLYHYIIKQYQVVLYFKTQDKAILMINYIKKHPEFFKWVQTNREIEVEGIDNCLIPELNEWIAIEDTHFNKRGKIKFMVNEKKLTTNIILIGSNSFEINDYLDGVEKYLANNRDMAIEKYYVRTATDEDGLYNDTQLITYKGDRTQLVDSFFHHDRDRLWSMLRAVEQDVEAYRRFGQSPRVGLILYGPPGTGKSTFIYRVAMALNRHVVSLKLEDLKYTKHLHKMIKTPQVNSKNHSHRDVVFVFDEMDYSLERLDQMERDQTATKYSDSSCQTNLEGLQLSVPESETKVADKSSIKKKETGIISRRDLLELFQGTVPLEGLIIIATTNSIDKIREYCPPLIRPGRLTPVFFDNGDFNLLQKMVQFYFERKLTSQDVLTLGIDVPTYRFQQSQLIELAMQCRLMFSEPDYAFAEFLSNFKRVMNDETEAVLQVAPEPSVVSSTDASTPISAVSVVSSTSCSSVGTDM